MNLGKIPLSHLVSVGAFAAASVIVLSGIASHLTTDRDPTSDASGSTAYTPGTVYIDNYISSTLDPDKISSGLNSDPDGSVLLVTSPSAFPNEKASLPGAGKLSNEGSSISDLTYSSDAFVIAKLTPTFDIPSSYSLRKRTVDKLSVVQESDYSEFTGVYTPTEEDRPAIETYMGYLFIDDGEHLAIVSSDGRYLTTFDDGNYIPAYTRDKSGSPLFYKTTTVESALTDGIDIVRKTETVRAREPHEKDETVLIEAKVKNEGEGNHATEETREYYKLSSDGSYFVRSDYNDLTDSRGLYFDYPAYYGIGTGDISLCAETYDKYLKNISGEISLEHRANWSYKRYGNALGDKKFERAYSFSEGLGCVVTESYYQDGGMYFVNSSGNRAFSTLRKYNNTTIDRYLIENIVPPVTTGPESIGYFYYEHGLVRARFETIDYWGYDSNNIIRVNSSKEVLLDKSGNQFPLPSGYELEAYSDGMIMLSRNGLYGFADYTGKWIAQPIYTAAEPFSEGLAVLTLPDGRCGMIDTAGNIVLPFGYKHISSCSSGVITAYSDENGWEIFLKMTK